MWSSTGQRDGLAQPQWVSSGTRERRGKGEKILGPAPEPLAVVCPRWRVGDGAEEPEWSTMTEDR